MKNKVRRIISIFGATCLALALVACSKPTEPTTNNPADNSTTSEQAQERKELAKLTDKNISLALVTKNSVTNMVIEKKDGEQLKTLTTAPVATDKQNLVVIRAFDGDDTIIAGTIVKQGKDVQKVTIIYNRESAKENGEFLYDSVTLAPEADGTAFLSTLPRDAKVFTVLVTDSKGTPQMQILNNNYMALDKNGKPEASELGSRSSIKGVAGKPDTASKEQEGWMNTPVAKSADGKYQLTLIRMQDGTAPCHELSRIADKASMSDIGKGPGDLQFVEAHCEEQTVLWGTTFKHADGKQVPDERIVKVGVVAGGELMHAHVQDGLYVIEAPKGVKMENIWFLDKNDNVIGSLGAPYNLVRVFGPAE